MSHPPQVDLVALLRELVDASVEFIVVGGGAAVLHGAPITTLDLDIVPRQSAENAARLLAVLERHSVFIIEPMKRRLRPRETDFLGRGQLNLSTDLGPLDVLCRLHDDRGYEELIDHTDVLTDGDVQLSVLDVKTLIEIKSGTGRYKDRMTVPILLAMLEDPPTGA